MSQSSLGRGLSQVTVDSQESNKSLLSMQTDVMDPNPPYVPLPHAPFEQRTGATIHSSQEEDDDDDEEEEEEEEEVDVELLKKRLQEDAFKIHMYVNDKALLHYIANYEILTNNGFTIEYIAEVCHLPAGTAAKHTKILKQHIQQCLKACMQQDDVDGEESAARNSTQDMDYFNADDNDDGDDDFVGADVPLEDMTAKNLQLLLVDKKAELQLLVDEKKPSPVKVVFQEFATMMKDQDKKEQGKASVSKMQEFINTSVFKGLSDDELTLLSSICMSTIRKRHLPSMIETLEGEVSSIEEAHGKALAAESMAKNKLKVDKAVENKKRQLASKGGSRKK